MTDPIEAIRARWSDAATLTDALLGAEGDVATLLAALDAARADAQRERERAEAAERECERWRKRFARATAAAISGPDTARREAIEEAVRAVEAWSVTSPEQTGPYWDGYQHGNDDAVVELRALIDGPPRDVRREAIEEAAGVADAAQLDWLAARIRALAPRSDEHAGEVER